jgi:hypothetical protein
LFAIALLSLVPLSAWAQAHARTTADAGCVGVESSQENDPAFALTLANFSGTGTEETCPPSDPRVGLALFSAGVSAADLRVGQLSVYGEATGAPAPDSYDHLVAGYGMATIQDTITVSGPSPTFSTQATISLHVEGDIQGYGWVFATIVVGGSLQRFSCVHTYPFGCTVGGPLIPAGPFSFDLTLDAPVSSSSPTLGLYTGMSANAINAGVADASSTATLSIQLPAGYSYTSGSGVLLVPEPSTFSLAIGAGSGLFGLFAYASATPRARAKGRRIAS